MPYKDPEKQKEYMRNWYHANKKKVSTRPESKNTGQSNKNKPLNSNHRPLDPEPQNPEPRTKSGDREQILRILKKATKGKISTDDFILSIKLLFTI